MAKNGHAPLVCCWLVFHASEWTKKPRREMLSTRRVELNQVRFTADTAFALVSSLCQSFSFLGDALRCHESPRSIIFIRSIIQERQCAAKSIIKPFKFHLGAGECSIETAFKLGFIFHRVANADDLPKVRF